MRAEFHRYSISFSDPIYKINGLTKENVITYFGRSEFYTDSEKAQYEVEQIDGDKLFKIVKYYLHQTEEKGDVKEVAAVYYVLNGDIYQCPDLYSLAKYRLYNCIQALNRSYDELKKYVDFSPFEGHMMQMTKVRNDEENGIVDESPTCNIIPLIGETRVRKRISTNYDRLNAMISTMEEAFVPQSMEEEQENKS